MIAMVVDSAEEMIQQLTSGQPSPMDYGELEKPAEVLEEDKESLSVPRIETRHVDALESWIDDLSADLGPLENFVLPGGSEGAALLHLARTVCRRAERRLVTLAANEPIGEYTVHYLNRLSDLLFVMARWENHAREVPDVLWDSRA